MSLYSISEWSHLNYVEKGLDDTIGWTTYQILNFIGPRDKPQQLTFTGQYSKAIVSVVPCSLTREAFDVLPSIAKHNSNSGSFILDNQSDIHLEELG